VDLIALSVAGTAAFISMRNKLLGKTASKSTCTVRTDPVRTVKIISDLSIIIKLTCICKKA